MSRFKLLALLTVAFLLLAVPCLADDLTLAAIYEYQETPSSTGPFASQSLPTYAAMPSIPTGNLTDGDPNTGELMQPWQNVGVGGNGLTNPPVFIYEYIVDPSLIGQNLSFTWTGSIADDLPMNNLYDLSVYQNGGFIVLQSGSDGSGGSGVVDSMTFTLDSSLIQNGDEIWLAARIRPDDPTQATVINSEIDLSTTTNAATVTVPLVGVPEPRSLFSLLAGLVPLIGVLAKRGAVTTAP